jgi:hypothetical protein
MGKWALPLKMFWGPFKFTGNIIHNIFKYLSCGECGRSDNRRLLRNLYNAGHIDEAKYHHYRERCLNDSFDPEEIHKSL